MRESQIEAYFNRRVKEIGGLTYKFVSPNRRGVPDRIAVFPGGLVAFVEIKAPGKFLRPEQIREVIRLRNSDANTFVADSFEAVNYFIDWVKSKCNYGRIKD